MDAITHKRILIKTKVITILKAANLSALGSGTYTVTITDANSCTKTKSLTLTESGSDWSMNGNTAIDANTKFIGTLDTSSVAFKTNNTERLRIKNDGSIGIGTKTPQAKLQVAGSVIIDSLKFTSSTANEMRVIGTRSDGKLQLSGLVMPLYPNQVACMVPVIGFSQTTDSAIVGVPKSRPRRRCRCLFSDNCNRGKH